MVSDDIDLPAYFVPVLLLPRLSGLKDRVRDSREQGTAVTVNRAWSKDDVSTGV